MKWALEVPMHMNPDDHSPEADEIRLHLYEQFLQRSRGRGFSIAPSSKHSKGRKPEFNRIIAIALNAKYGERTPDGSSS